MSAQDRPSKVTPRIVAARVVKRVLTEGAWTGPALSAALDEFPMEPRDKALCSELARGTLRWSVPLEAALRRAMDKPKKIDRRVLPHLLVAAYQLQHLGERVPARAAVHEAVEAVKRERRPLAGFANALLRNLGSAPHLQLAEGASLEAIAAAYGVPLALAEAVTAGVDAHDRAAAVGALNDRPSLGLYAVDSEALLGRLIEEGLAARPHPFVPGAVLVDGGGDPRELPGHAEGTTSVMDPGSALVALAAWAPGRVLDCCAAPGSKSLVLARQPNTEVVSIERDPRRAARIDENVARTELPIEVRVADAAAADLAPESSFDAVLVDAPCSALGTTRRRPDVKLQRHDDDPAARGALQRALLAAAAPRVKPGGALTYAVCSPLPDEGPEVVAAFLASPAGAGYARVDLGAHLGWLPETTLDAEGAVRLNTWRHDADGFYVARLVRAR